MRKERTLDIFFYRSGFRNAITLLQWLLVVLIVLIVGFGLALVLKEESVYYATSSSGKLTSLSAYSSAKIAQSVKLNPDDAN